MFAVLRPIPNDGNGWHSDLMLVEKRHAFVTTAIMMKESLAKNRQVLLLGGLAVLLAYLAGTLYLKSFWDDPARPQIVGRAAVEAGFKLQGTRCESITQMRPLDEAKKMIEITCAEGGGSSDTIRYIYNRSTKQLHRP